MKILGIETSCDETSASVVENGTKILSNIVASSVELHKKSGGIIPEVAAREQIKCIISVVEEAIGKLDYPNRNFDPDRKFIPKIDAIAVTTGPGLIGSLLVGVETAKTLAFAWQKPIIPVNHLLAHIYANWLEKEKHPEFPALALIASGGHTELVLVKDHGKFVWLGGTRDDAAGEVFDKIARLLGLGFPGGPEIAAEAKYYEKATGRRGRRAKSNNLKLPRPMIKENNLDFSFSGLKTAVLREVIRLKTIRQFNKQVVQHLAYGTQEAITDCLVKKTVKAAQKYKAKSILLSGGVAANKRLREKIKLDIRNSELEISLSVPSPSLCTDNAAFIGSYAYFNFKPQPFKKIIARPDLDPLDIF